jgi:hypothetical protein
VLRDAFHLSDDEAVRIARDSSRAVPFLERNAVDTLV